jgi:hypothetical protein
MEWSEFYAALLGGGVSLATGMAFFYLEHRRASKSAKQNQLDKNEAIAFRTLVQLTNMAADISAIKECVDECFKEAPDPDFDPGVKLQPIVGSFMSPISIGDDQLALAMKSGDEGLINKLMGLQRRHKIILGLVDEFNEKRAEYSAFVLEVSTRATKMDGVQNTVSMPSNSSHRNDARVAILNQLSNFIVEVVEVDGKFAIESVLRFQSAMKSNLGLKVPHVLINGGMR